MLVRLTWIQDCKGQAYQQTLVHLYTVLWSDDSAQLCALCLSTIIFKPNQEVSFCSDVVPVDRHNSVFVEGLTIQRVCRRNVPSAGLGHSIGLSAQDKASVTVQDRQAGSAPLLASETALLQAQMNASLQSMKNAKAEVRHHC